MSESRYSVIFTGQLKPELAAETVVSNLVLDIGLDQLKAVKLVQQQGRVVLKRCDTVIEAQRLAEKFDRSGAICIIEDRVTRADPPQNGSGESSLVKLINKFIPSSRPAGSAIARK